MNCLSIIHFIVGDYGSYLLLTLPKTSISQGCRLEFSTTLCMYVCVYVCSTNTLTSQRKNERKRETNIYWAPNVDLDPEGLYNYQILMTYY